MKVTNSFPYRFFPAEAGMLVEIYLPKKSNFQGTLYDTLTTGFDIERVREHFLDPDKQPSIRKLLDNYPEVVDFDEAAIAALPPLFQGYTMYEVDGVFYSRGSRDSHEIHEEKTQIIRIIFKPELKFLAIRHPGRETEIQDCVREFLNSAGSSVEGNDLHLEVADYLGSWVDQVGLFLHGFIVYELCARISRLCSDGVMDWEKAEKEIWVSTQWHLDISRVKFTPNWNCNVQSLDIYMT